MIARMGMSHDCNPHVHEKPQRVPAREPPFRIHDIEHQLLGDTHSNYRLTEPNAHSKKSCCNIAARAGQCDELSRPHTHPTCGGAARMVQVSCSCVYGLRSAKLLNLIGKPNHSWHAKRRTSRVSPLLTWACFDGHV